jgi:hypothetical protein
VIGNNRWDLTKLDEPRGGKAHATQATAGDAKEDRFPLITCAALDAEDYTPQPIITDCLYVGHPAVAGGMFKTLKTLVVIDGAISIASGRPFLNMFTVSEPLGVVYFSGEGGPSMVQEYARRVAYSKGFDRLADVQKLHWCFTIPKLESLEDLDAIQRKHDETAAALMVFDNLMLALSGDEAGNVFKMGQILGNVVRICNERGITPFFIHHFKRTRPDPYAPGELLDLSQAGTAEVAGQWWFLTRREKFDPDNPGEHKIDLNIGGRLGHGCLHSLIVHEGRLSDPGGRRWDVEVRKPSDEREEARKEWKGKQEQDRTEKLAEKLEDTKKRILKAAAKFKQGETATVLRDFAALHDREFKPALAELLEGAALVPADIHKSNRKKPYPGYILASYQTTQG